MRKKYFYAAAMAAMLASCSSDDLSLSSKSVKTEAPGVEGAVNFSAYTPRSITRAGYAGVMTTEQLQKTKEEGGGFGVFGYYTDQQDYDLQISRPNFMYNQGVFYAGGKWGYEPVKYWPNEYGADAESQDIDKVTFFAYAPYVDVNPTTGKVTGDAASGITAVSRNTNTGDPIVWYKGSFKPSEAVDLCWGTVADDAQDWAIIQDNGIQRMDAGLPWLNVQRPKGVTYDEQKLKFQFKHALSQLNIQIDADPDLTEHNETDTLKAGTKVYVRSITINGLASKGSLNLNNIVAGEPLWQSYYGSGSIYAETATIRDGRRDGKEGVAGATAVNETLTGLNPQIISDDGNTTTGVTHELQNLFDAAALTDAIYTIPTGEPITVSIVYDVETKDSLLANVISDGVTRGSSIENKITKEVVFGEDEYLKAGKKYTLILHLGLNSVKFDAAVSEWVDNSASGETWLPSNVAKGVTLNKTRVAIAAAETLTATVTPSDVVNKEIVWTSSDPTIATVADGVVTPVANAFGEVTISAYNPGTGKTAECVVLVTRSASTPITTDEEKAQWIGKYVGRADGLLYESSSQAISYGAQGAGVVLASSKLAIGLGDLAKNCTYSALQGCTVSYMTRMWGEYEGATWAVPSVEQLQLIFRDLGNNGATQILSITTAESGTGYHKKFDGTAGSGSGANATTFDLMPASDADGAEVWVWSNDAALVSNLIVPHGNLSWSKASYWTSDAYDADRTWDYTFGAQHFWARPNATWKANIRPVLVY